MKRWLLPVTILLILTIPAVTEILKLGWFRMHDDLQIMRQYEMDKCFNDRQIPCRWVPDMGYGYGFPLFNYYPPLPYLIGEIFHRAGFSFLDAVKIVFSLSLVLSGLTMYLLTYEFWGKWGGLVAGVFYVWAPYRAVDVYVRGAMNESWALVWLPAILWGIYKIITKNYWRHVAILSFFTAMLLLSHNPITMIFVPWAAVWALFWLWQKGNQKLIKLIELIGSGIFALGLAAFFTLPAIFEQKYAHLETLGIGYFNYLAHFADLNQLFLSRFWGYGASYLGPGDEMSFSIGHLHWLLSFFAIAVAWYFRRKNPATALLVLLTFFLTYGYTFMTHSRSTPIWQTIGPLEFLQFPWRFLTMSVLGTSFLSGATVFLLENLKGKFYRWLSFGVVFLLLAAVIVINKDYFRWAEYWPTMTDSEKLAGKLWKAQQTSGIFDYLPIYAPLPPADPPKGDGEFLEGEGEYKTLEKSSNKQKYQLEVNTEKAVFQINTFYFPGWRVKLDGEMVKVDPKDDPELGRMRLAVPRGKHEVEAVFTNTPIRRVSNFFSLVSWLIMGIAVFKLGTIFTPCVCGRTHTVCEGKGR